MIGRRQKVLDRGSIDWWSILIYVALLIMGWLNIYATISTESGAAIFDFSQRYGQQLVWIGVSSVAAIVILLIDDRFYHIFAYPLYVAMIVVLLAVLVVGTEVNGAKAWLVIGPLAVQPGEFAKFTTALAVARYMSRYSFSIKSFSDFMKLMVITFLPAVIIILQNDMGSALVYGAFFFAFFREGLNMWIYVALILATFLFLTSLVLTPFTVLVMIVLIAVIGEALENGRWKSTVIFLSTIALLTSLLYFGSNMFFDYNLSLYVSLLISSALVIPLVIAYAYRQRLRRVYRYLMIFVASVMFVSTVDYVFDNMLQLHQQQRILHLLGLESDPRGWGYNVNQSKIAIGSGGLLGKGFQQGTQTKFDFVPEQTTDFIFCTVGEEWGFVGSSVVVVLFCLLILRIMKMGERQRDPFGRVYCYSVAGIFFLHVIINIGMTIGIMPVIGIPLPFFSYGGSSFLTFSTMFFVAVRLDSGKRELLRR